MQTPEYLIATLHREGLSRKDKALLLLTIDPETPKSLPEIREIAVKAGLREIQKWNVSDILGSTKGLAIRVDGGWMLTMEGRNHLRDKGLAFVTTPAITNIMGDLRTRASAVANADTKQFLNEAIACLEIRAYRAAIVFSWVGAISVLHNYVVQHHLSAFNTEAKHRNTKWSDAKTTDDLGRMKEHDFLNVLEAISLLGKNTKQELQTSLQLRNACGHPSSLAVGEHRAIAHIETLILNVFSKF